MFKDITIGQYFPGNSPIHRINPAVKIILTIAYIAILFFITNPIAYLIFGVYTITLIMLSGVPFRYILEGLKPLVWIVLLTSVLNIFMTNGTTIAEIPLYRFSLKITKEGIVTAVKVTLRLVFLMTGSSLLTLTTEPLQLTDGIERLLNPLKRIGVPSHEIAMMMSIALRFMPTFAEEAEKIMNAQKARGADFETGNIIERAKAMIPVLVPLFVSAFRRADDLATAMEARCYNGGENRTRMKESKIGKYDIKVCVIFVICLVILEAAEIIIEI